LKEQKAPGKMPTQFAEEDSYMKTMGKVVLILAISGISTGVCFADIAVATGAGLSGGQVDTTWTTGLSAYPNPVVISPANIPQGCTPRGAISYCWAPDTASSSWVGLTDTISQPLGSWDIETTVTAGADEVLTGMVGFDDYGSLIVNGNTVLLTTYDNFGILFGFTVALNAGLNTIELDLAPTAGDPSNEGYDGVRLDADITPAPEPGYYGLLAIGLTGLGIVRRRSASNRPN
jgi:hypothetical protein